jgi:uncharacterized protein (TIGR02284 family)
MEIAMLTPENARVILAEATSETEGMGSGAAAAVAALHTRTLDALAGYVRMVEKAEPEFRPTAERFRDLHARHADQLAVILAAMGGHPEEDGSIMGTINETVVSLRAFFDEIDEDVMDNVRSGEDHVLHAFDGALEEGLADPDQTTIAAMRDELQALLDDTRHLD